jgi:hypothetical protein
MTSPFNEGRRFCLIAGGHLGYVPEEAKVGDYTVCLLYRATLLYVVIYALGIADYNLK